MEQLQLIQQNVSRLVSAYTRARRDNDALQEQLSRKEDELADLRAELKQLQNDYKTLQVAHALTVDTPQRQKAKRHLQSIIADIDKTIEALKH